MVQVPIPIVIVQWVVLFALGFLVILSYRQLAYLLHLSSDSEGQGGLAVQEKAPSFEYLPYSTGASANQPRSFDPTGRPSVVMFSDPLCGACDSALKALDKLRLRHIGTNLRFLAVSDAAPDVAASLGAFKEITIDAGTVDQIVSASYQVHTTPYLYGIDALGIIQASGYASDEDQIDEMLKPILEPYRHQVHALAEGDGHQ